MEHWIETVCEPKRLLLAWQSPDPSGERTRFAVAELIREGSDCILRYFQNESVKKAQALGYIGYPAFDISKEHKTGVLAAFLRRLPPRTRSDFSEYKAQFRLSRTLDLTNFALLAYTEARLPSDGFSIVNPLDDATPPCQYMLEVAGFRHHVDQLLAPLTLGQSLTLVPEPNNKFDTNAVRIEADGVLVGYVNRLQAPAFLRWIGADAVEAFIERLNGNVSRPRLFMFVNVKQKSAAQAA